MELSDGISMTEVILGGNTCIFKDTLNIIVAARLKNGLNIQSELDFGWRYEKSDGEERVDKHRKWKVTLVVPDVLTIDGLKNIRSEHKRKKGLCWRISKYSTVV